LVSVDPNNATYRGLLADNYLHLGEALYQAERGATVADYWEAIAYFRKALAIHDALAASNPASADYRYAKGVDYEYVGIAFNKLGDLTGDAANYRAALDNHREELKINEALVASDPGNGRYRRILADVYGEVGLSQLKLGNTAEALENFRRKVAIFESMRASDPTNVEAQLDVALAYREVGQALAQSGDTGGAITEERKAVAILQALRNAEPNNTETSMHLLRSLEALGQALEGTRDFAGASENYRRAQALLAARSKLEPDNVLIQRLLAEEKANVERADKAEQGGKEVSR
jgi:tetratricopeptide (TPR) repeat protein